MVGAGGGGAQEYFKSNRTLITDRSPKACAAVAGRGGVVGRLLYCIQYSISHTLAVELELE